MSLWEKDPNLYYNVYYEGCNIFNNKYMALGNKLDKALEADMCEDDDPMIKFMLVFMPKYPERQKIVKAMLEGIELLAKMDGWNEETFTIGEYKSGRKWTQKMVDDSGQITFYALVIYLIYGKIPNLILHWAKTCDDENGELQLTGDIRTFKTARTVPQLIAFTDRIFKSAKGIDQLGKFVRGESV